MSKQVTESEVEFTVIAEQDDVLVCGNASASGDDEADAECENAIIERMNGGDVWAWANVQVKASYRGITGESSWLGGCSYADEADFKKPGGYCDDMKAEALADLNAKLGAIAGWLCVEY